MQRRWFLGITVMPEYVQTEGVAKVLDTLTALGATAVYRAQDKAAWPATRLPPDHNGACAGCPPATSAATGKVARQSSECSAATSLRAPSTASLRCKRGVAMLHCGVRTQTPTWNRLGPATWTMLSMKSWRLTTSANCSTRIMGHGL